MGLDPHEGYLIWEQGDRDFAIPDRSIFALEPMIRKPALLSLEDTVLVVEGENEILSSRGDWSELPVLGQRIRVPS